MPILITKRVPEAAKSLTDYANVVVVDPAGNGDYTTQAAALAAITDDSASNIYNVFVFGEVVAWATWAGRPFIKVHGHDCKVYRATLTQSGTDAPVATVLENSIGAIVWTRYSDGTYVGTLTNAFPSAAKTYCMASQPYGDGTLPFSAILRRTTSATVRLSLWDIVNQTTYDDILLSSPVAIEIRVYP